MSVPLFIVPSSVSEVLDLPGHASAYPSSQLYACTTVNGSISCGYNAHTYPGPCGCSELLWRSTGYQALLLFVFRLVLCHDSATNIGCRQAVYRRVVDAAQLVADRMGGSEPCAWVVTGFITPHTEVVVTDVRKEAELS